MPRNACFIDQIIEKISEYSEIHFQIDLIPNIRVNLN